MLQHTQAQMWLAVQARDTSLDGQFVFAVVTTGIFVGQAVGRAFLYPKMSVFSRMSPRPSRQVFAPVNGAGPPVTHRNSNVSTAWRRPAA